MIQLSLLDIRQMMRDRNRFLSTYHAQHGGFLHFNVLGSEFFVVSDPELMRALLVKHAKHLHRDAFAAETFRRFMGEGVFTAEGERWRQKRKLLQPMFHLSQFDWYVKVFAHCTEEMVAGWQGGGTVVIDQALRMLTSRIVAKTMMGVDSRSDVAKIGRNMDMLVAVSEKYLLANRTPPEWLPTLNMLRYRWANRQIRNHLQAVIDDRRTTSAENKDLISILLTARYEDGTPLTDRDIIDELITISFAGYRTSAEMLTWVWYLLMKNPETVSELTTEVTHALDDGALSYEKLNAMPRLEAVIKEALRLYPPLPTFGRAVIKPFTIGDRVFKEGQMILFNILDLHHNADHYPNPDKFQPARFLDSKRAPDRYAFLPFGVGPRVCIGNAFAMIEAKTILATMLSRVKLQRANQNPVVPYTGFTMRPQAPLQVKITGLTRCPNRN